MAHLVIALCHTPNIFPKRSLPDLHSGRIVHQPFVACDGFTCCWMDHRGCEVHIVGEIFNKVMMDILVHDPGDFVGKSTEAKNVGDGFIIGNDVGAVRRLVRWARVWGHIVEQ